MPRRAQRPRNKLIAFGISEQQESLQLSLFGEGHPQFV
jgi:hypothetical protein